MQSTRTLLFAISCILFVCSCPAPGPETLNIEIKQSQKDPNLYGGAKRIPANSGIKLLAVKPNYRVTVMQELQDGQHQTLYQITVPDDAGGLVVPISTTASGSSIIVAVSFHAMEEKLRVAPPCVICMEAGVPCCPPKNP